MRQNQTKISKSLFTSDRERRLWAWTLAVVLALYSTLGLAGTLAGALHDRGLLAPVFWLSLILVGATVLTQGLKTRPRGAEIAVALGVVAAYLMMFVRMAVTAAERTHLMEYSVVAVFIYAALTERARPVGQLSNGASQGRRVPVPALLAILGATLVGVLDECTQVFLPSRVFDPIDILFNFLAAMMAVTASAALGWAQRLGRRIRRG